MLQCGGSVVPTHLQHNFCLHLVMLHTRSLCVSIVTSSMHCGVHPTKHSNPRMRGFTKEEEEMGDESGTNSKLH